jgi:signal transduction histidine kinase
MKEASVTVSGPAGKKTEVLNSPDTTLGRGRMCDIILNDDSVSRLHARIFRNAGGIWMIEDMDSRNGVIIDGQRVKSHALTCGNTIKISYFVLTFNEHSSGQRSEEKSGHSPADNARHFHDHHALDTVIMYRPESATILGPALLPVFNSLAEKLLAMTTSTELYAQACRHLEESLHGFFAIVRLPFPLQTDRGEPRILAFEGSKTNDPDVGKSDGYRFSQSVLEAVCSTEEPVMTQSHPTSGQDLSLTIVNHIDPRVVFAAPVNIVDDTIDILYVDLPADQSPDAMFDFVEAVSRQINYIQKNLFYQELQITAKALREANAALKDKDRIKDEYVSRITHDIKGHLGVIKSSLAIADDHSGIGSPEDKVKFIGRASDRTTQLLEFIAELLRITKLRLGGQMVETTFSLKDAITKSLETVAPGARDKLISLKANVTEDIDTMIGDELSITEVITNLLFNAIKYSPENESVTLQAMVEHDQVLITISDTGIGIPPEEVDQVFQEFFRASNAITFAKDGTGLGLALVKQIVERHGGTITAKNNTGKGAVFSIVLPI